MFTNLQFIALDCIVTQTVLPSAYIYSVCTPLGTYERIDTGQFRATRSTKYALVKYTRSMLICGWLCMHMFRPVHYKYSYLRSYNKKSNTSSWNNMTNSLWAKILSCKSESLYTTLVTAYRVIQITMLIERSSTRFCHLYLIFTHLPSHCIFLLRIILPVILGESVLPLHQRSRGEESIGDMRCQSLHIYFK